MLTGKEIVLSSVPARLILAGSLIFAAEVASADSEGRENALRQCYNIEDAVRRLSCYDLYAKTWVGRPDKGLAIRSTEAVADTNLPERPRQELNQEQFGANQVKTKKSESLEPKSITALVDRVTESRRNLRTFHLANGQVWRQTEPSYISIPKTGNFEVVVSKGAIGGYRLRVDGKGKMARVKRIL